MSAPLDDAEGNMCTLIFSTKLIIMFAGMHILHVIKGKLTDAIFVETKLETCNSRIFTAA